MSPAPAVVLLSGATGFVGKVVLAELLGRRKALGVERVLALVRAGDPERADARLRVDVLDSPCFAHEAPGWEKHVEALAGDLTRPALGLAAEARERVRAEVTHVIHCAASIEFSLPLVHAAAVNTMGALHALELARSCPRLACFVGVSTAYVTPHPAAGSGRSLRAEERLAPLPHDPERLHAAILSGQCNEGRLLRETGHPNTYTLTKSLAEHLVARRADGLPITLVRPSIVSASRARPLPGWIDSPAAFAAFVAAIGTGRVRVVAGNLGARLDVVPCDEVAERIVAAAFRAAPGALRIQHAVAGLAGSPSIALCRERIVRHFDKSDVGTPRLAWVGPRGPRFRAEHALRHELPGRAAALGLRLRGDSRRALAARRLLDRQRDMNRDFAYFTHATFDFQTSQPLAPPLEPAAYLDLVCEGVERHLLRREGRRGAAPSLTTPPSRPRR